MSPSLDKINKYLQSLGFLEQMDSGGTWAPGSAGVNLLHSGVSIMVHYWYEAGILVMDIGIAYMPRTNVAPFMRRLLELNGGMSAGFFFGVDAADLVMFRGMRYGEGLDLSEFKQMLDGGAQTYYTFAPALIQEFQLPLQPT
jgi:hypothetical protein